MTDLQSKLQNATEGSRELSDEVLTALGWQYDDTGDARSRCWVDPTGKGYDYWDDPHARSRQPIPSRPDPTRNLQDAVDLVSDEWIWTLNSLGECTLYRKNRLDMHIEGCAATPPLSVCDAIIAAQPLTDRTR